MVGGMQRLHETSGGPKAGMRGLCGVALSAERRNVSPQ